MSLPAMLEHTPAGENARALPRRRLRLSVPAIVSTGARNAVVHDISVGGLLLETDSAVAADELIAIELPDVDQVEARVVWSSGRFFGCEFTETLPTRIVSASLLKAEPLPRSNHQAGASETESAFKEQERFERGNLSTAARIQIVVAISLALWSLIGTAIYTL